MKKYHYHILFILMYLVFGALLLFAVKGSFSTYDNWICDGVSYSEKGVTQEEIDFCTNLGKYTPGLTPKFLGASYAVAIALISLSSVFAVVGLLYVGMKHYQVLRKN